MLETGVSRLPRQPQRQSAATGPEFLGGFGGAQARMRSKMFIGTHCRRAPNVMHSAVSETFVRKTKQIIEHIAHRVRTRRFVPNGARRYAQCGFVDMRSLERFMWQHVRCMFCNFAKTASNGDHIQSMKISRECLKNLQTQSKIEEHHSKAMNIKLKWLDLRVVLGRV